MSDLLHELIATITLGAVNHNINLTEENKVLIADWYLEKGIICDYENLSKILLEFPQRDKVEVSFSPLVGDSISLTNKNILSKEDVYNCFLEGLLADEEMEIQIIISKEIMDGIMSIYNMEAFNRYLFSKSIKDIIAFFALDLGTEKGIVFELFDSKMVLATNTILFRPHDFTYTNCIEFDRLERMKTCRKNSYVFWKSDNLPVPDDFHFVVDDMLDNPYKEIFGCIESILSIVYIADNVHFHEDKIICQIIGQRMSVYEFSYDEITYNETLYDVYSWIYTDGNIVDKVTLARNLLSLHCRQMKLKDIDYKTFMSIKANFSLYQKENVNKYMELKNSMTIFLKDTMNQSKEIITDILGQIGRNITAYLSFLLTVFLSEVVSGNTQEDIFSQSITWISYAIVAGSFIYIFMTQCIYKYKVNDLQKSYDLIKRNNDFLIDTKEYTEIFRDEEVQNIIKDIEKNKFILFIVWILFIILFWAVIEFASEYSFSKQFIEFLQNQITN